MRRSRLFLSPQPRHRYFGSPPLRRAFSLATAIVALMLVSLGLLRRTNRTPETSASSSRTHQPQALADPSTPQLQGDWDLLWKDQRGVLLRTHCQIRQDGAVLTLHVSDPQLLSADARTSIHGIVEGETISFRIHLQNGDPLVITGKMDDGILHGTTNRGFSWMAVRNTK